MVLYASFHKPFTLRSSFTESHRARHSIKDFQLSFSVGAFFMQKKKGELFEY